MVNAEMEGSQTGKIKVTRRISSRTDTKKYVRIFR